MDIEYVQLTESNFSVFSLDGFIRKQTVTRCWRKDNGEYKLKPVVYTEDWTVEERRQIAEKILNGMRHNNAAFAAVISDEIVGFAYLDLTPFGSADQYVDLAEFYVSLPHRRRGIGRRLFEEACKAAKKCGARKLYISAHSAENSIAAYEKYGCRQAVEVNARLAEKEPCDLQLEYNL